MSAFKSVHRDRIPVAAPLRAIGVVNVTTVGTRRFVTITFPVPDDVAQLVDSDEPEVEIVVDVRKKVR